jgi:hypothetical protein
MIQSQSFSRYRMEICTNIKVDRYRLMVISVIIRKFQIVVYHTLLRVTDSCAHLNISVHLIHHDSAVQFKNNSLLRGAA